MLTRYNAMHACANYAIIQFSIFLPFPPLNSSHFISHPLDELPCWGDGARARGSNVDANAISSDESRSTNSVDLVNTSSLGGACVEALGIELQVSDSVFGGLRSVEERRANAALGGGCRVCDCVSQLSVCGHVSLLSTWNDDIEAEARFGIWLSCDSGAVTGCKYMLVTEPE